MLRFKKEKLMEITGKELYNAYKKGCARQGVEIDSWEDLDDIDRECWVSTALILWDE
jgi:hypothetical protein